MRKILAACTAAAALTVALQATEIHVSVSGKDSNPATQAAPLRTIQRAADLARPGDVVTVHKGVYRERVSPPRGGESDAMTDRLSRRAGRESRDQGLRSPGRLDQSPG